MGFNGMVFDRKSYSGAERREKLRIFERYPATVRGKNADGDRFEINGELDDIGLHGLHLRLNRVIGPGEDIFVVVSLISLNESSAFAARLAVRGKVLRAEPTTHGSIGIAVQVRKRRFI